MNDMMQAFSGDPKTTVAQVNAETHVTVEATSLAPGDAKKADLDGVLCMLAIMIVSVVIGFNEQDVRIPLVGWFIAAAGLSFFREEGRKHAQKVATIVLTETTIFLKEPPQLFQADKWRSFDRRHPHRFVLVAHERAQAEQDDIQFRQRQGNVRVRRYYTDSFFVVLEHLGQRYDIAEVMGPRNANAILARLNLCDDFLDGIVSDRQLLPTRPEHQWSGALGSVPKE